MSENEKKEAQIPVDSQKVKTQPFAQVISAPTIDLSEGISRAGIKKGTIKPFAEVITVYRKDI